MSGAPGVEPRVIGLGDGHEPGWLTPERAASVLAAEGRPFADEEYERRADAVRARMTERGIDAVLVFRPSSIEYLCGYHTAETAPQPLLVTSSDTYLYVADLEVGRALASARVGSVAYCGYADALRSLQLFLEHAATVVSRPGRIALDLDHASTPPRAIEMLRGAGVTVVEADYLVERIRLVLSDAEIACVAAAAEPTQAGVEAAVAAARESGATDSSVAAAIAAALFQRADSASAWGPVVATGPRAGIAHSSWVNRPLDDGTTFLEFAGTCHRYHAPVMRTLVRGKPGAEHERLAEMAKAAVAAVLEHAKAGVPCSRVAAAAAKAVGPLPDDVVFHGLFGYPVGLAHKPHWMDSVPFYITPDNHELLREGMVFHVPASFRSFGSCGVGLSQTLVVERDGARALTHGAAELIEV